MRRSSLAVHVVLLIVSIVALTALVQAQYRASIQGVVTDPQGAVVSGATITLKNNETGQTQTTTSSETGLYNFNGLPPSKFTLTAERTGFKKKVIESFGIIPEQANAVNVELEVGQVTESVTVNGGDVPLLDTESSNLGGSVRAKDFQSLPSIGRDPFQLLQLAPGAFGDGAQGAGGGTSNLPGTTVGGTGATDGIFKIENKGQITANGARTENNNYTIDGVNTVSVTWGGTSVITPNEDSIKEVRVVTDNYDAENGRFSGAQVQIISQNGTNDYHGSLFFKAHRPGLNAFTKYNGYNSNLPGCKAPCGNVRDSFRFNDYGGTAGGPILKNKIFAFFSYETVVNNAAVSLQAPAWYETSAYRGLAQANTNASKFFTFDNSKGVVPLGGHQVDVSCASAGLQEFNAVLNTGNCITIPGQGLNIGRPLNSSFAPGQPDPSWQSNSNPGLGGDGTGNPAANLDPNTADIALISGTNSPSSATHRQYNGRLDFNATSKDLIAFSLYYVPNTSFGINGNGNRSMNGFNSGNTNRAMTILWDHTFSPSMQNEARANAAGWMDRDLALNPSAPWGLPQVGFNGIGNFSPQGYGIGSYNGFDQWTLGFKDVLTKIHGAHTMKMGGEFTHLKSVDAPFWSDRPGYTFRNMWDFLNDAPITENGQFDPKTGVPTALRKDLRSNIVGLFFQDNFKARPNLTLTAGLRWEYFGPVTEKTGKLATVVLGRGANQFTDLRLRTGGGQVNAQKTNFGPQLGFAWSPGELAGHQFNSRLVVRGGMGIAFDGVAQSNTLDVRFNPPYTDNNQNLCNQYVPGCAAGQTLLYIGAFPTKLTDSNHYAPQPNTIASFDSKNLPIDPVTGKEKCCVDLTALPANLATTYTYHYTLGGEYDLGHNWVASVGYQGSTTRHSTQHYNLYDVGAARGLMFQPVVHGITYYDNNGSGRFNALLLELKHAFGQSFSLDTQYRYSHAMDSGSNAYAGGYYQWNMNTNFANADFDTRHAFKLYGVYSPTIFKGANNWMEKIAGGWVISGILNAHTGFPWTPLYNWQGASDIGNGYDPVFSFGQGNGGSSGDAGSNKYLPAAYLGGFHPNYRGTGLQTINAQPYFTPPTLVPGTLFDCLFPNPPIAECPSGQQGYGPLPSLPGIARNAFYGPGYFDVDATLSKSFGLPKMPIMGEGAKLEIRANFYNVFNKLNLNGNGGEWSNGVMSDIGNGHFGQSQSALGSRVIEMQARFSF